MRLDLSALSSAPATRAPSLSFPTRFSFGTLTSSRNVSQKSKAPAMFWIGRTVTPGDFISIKRKLMPRCFLGAFGSVLTRKKPQSERWAPVVQIFWPLTTKLSPLSTARVCREKRSEPAFGSLNPSHQNTSPLPHGIKCFRFCSSVPFARSIGASISSPKPLTPGRLTFDVSSVKTSFKGMPAAPLPPYSSGQVNDSQPRCPPLPAPPHLPPGPPTPPPPPPPSVLSSPPPWLHPFP